VCKNNHLKCWGIVVLALLFFSIGAVSAQGNANQYLQISLTGYLVTQSTDDKGVTKEHLGVLPDTVLPGYVIQYEIIATNTASGSLSADILRNVSLIGVIPKGTVYIEYSVSDAGQASFSIDGGKTYSLWPISYKAKLPDGSEIIRKAGPELCTGIRWIIPEIKPQDTRKVVYRVKVRAG
jgi:uncharacterized repeat protein (TIGR01451 family)